MNVYRVILVYFFNFVRIFLFFFFFQAEDGIRDFHVTGVQTCALPIFRRSGAIRTTPRRRSGQSTRPPRHRSPCHILRARGSAPTPGHAGCRRQPASDAARLRAPLQTPLPGLSSALRSACPDATWSEWIRVPACRAPPVRGKKARGCRESLRPPSDVPVGPSATAPVPLPPHDPPEHRRCGVPSLQADARRPLARSWIPATLAWRRSGAAALRPLQAPAGSGSAPRPDRPANAMTGPSDRWADRLREEGCATGRP